MEKIDSKTPKMKLVGLIGGISWTSTIEYYKQMNTLVNQLTNSISSSKILLYSLNLTDIVDSIFKGDYEKVGKYLYEISEILINSGVDFFLICSNTSHLAANYIEAEFSKAFPNKRCPLLHIGNCTAIEIKDKYPEMKKLGFVGTRYTMTQDFLVKRIKSFGINIVVPKSKDELEELHRIIEEDLSRNDYSEKSKSYLLGVIENLVKTEEIEGIILGCTELPVLLNFAEKLSFQSIKKDIIVFDTLKIHINAAVKVQLGLNSLEDFFIQKDEDLLTKSFETTRLQ